MDPNAKETSEVMLIDVNDEVDSSCQTQERAPTPPGEDFDALIELQDLFGKSFSSFSSRSSSPHQKPIVEQPLESAPQAQHPKASPVRQLFRTGGFTDVVSQSNTNNGKDGPLKFGSPESGMASSRGFPKSEYKIYHLSGFGPNVTDDRNNNKTDSAHNEMGFGCSNTEIARRMSGRGRSSNARRRRGTPRHSTRSISQKPPANDTNQANSQSLNDNVVLPPITPTIFDSERPKESNNNAPPSSPKNSPSSQKRQLCEKCGRYGHSPAVCYSMAHTSVLRCYNCHKIGHLAARCPLFGPGGRRGRHQRSSSKAVDSLQSNTTSTTSATDSSAIANSQNGSLTVKVEKDDKEKKVELDVTGVEIICKLMQDPHMRKEVMRYTPGIYDEMIAVMIQHVKL